MAWELIAFPLVRSDWGRCGLIVLASPPGSPMVQNAWSGLVIWMQTVWDKPSWLGLLLGPVAWRETPGTGTELITPRPTFRLKIPRLPPLHWVRYVAKEEQLCLSLEGCSSHLRAAAKLPARTVLALVLERLVMSLSNPAPPNFAPFSHHNARLWNSNPGILTSYSFPGTPRYFP